MRCKKVCLLVAGLLVGRVCAELPIAGAVELGVPMTVGGPVEAQTSERVDSRFTAPQQDDRLGFVNRDRIHGRLSAASASAGRLTWNHAAAREEILFDLASLAEIQLASRRTSRAPAYEAAVHLTNGDILPGRIVGMNDDILELDTWFAGQINVNRSMVMRILPNLSMSNVLFEGPNDLAEWTLSPHGGNRPQWRYSEGALYSIQQYPAGRMIEGLPDQYEVRFDAAWRGSFPQFMFVFSTPDVQQSTDAYTLNIQGTTISLSRSSRNRGGSSIGSRINYTGFGGNMSQRSASFLVLVDKAARSITLLIDDSIVGQWTDPDEFAGQGNGIAFRSGSAGDLKISSIKVANWDGQVPGAISTGEPTGKDDQVRFVNNDKFSGRVISIAEGALQLETTYATLEIPINRVMEISMAGDSAERARRNRDDVRAVFVDRGLLTLNLDRIEDDMLHGESENFGSISVPLGVIKILEWNIYREKADDDSDDF